MVVCCIVFDIDGMLLEFCLNFLNISKNNLFFFKISCFLSVSCYFQHLKKKIGYKQKIRGGGGGVNKFRGGGGECWKCFFLEE